MTSTYAYRFRMDVFKHSRSASSIYSTLLLAVRNRSLRSEVRLLLGSLLGLPGLLTVNVLLATSLVLQAVVGKIVRLGEGRIAQMRHWSGPLIVLLHGKHICHRGHTTDLDVSARALDLSQASALLCSLHRACNVVECCIGSIRRLGMLREHERVYNLVRSRLVFLIQSESQNR